MIATENVQSYQFSYGGYNFTLIDTPGFDDDRFGDDIIVEKVLQWLKGMTNSDQKLNGIIYMHRITDARIQGSARASMRIFRKLCGPQYYNNVILGTTFWDIVDPKLGAERETELVENDTFWGLMAKQGSKVCRVGYSKQDDLRLLHRLAQNQEALLHAQKEMKAGKKPSETAAAQSVNDDLANLAKEFDRKLKVEEARTKQKLQELDNRRKAQFDAVKAAFDNEEAQRQAEDLRREEKARNEWESRQKARRDQQHRKEMEIQAKYNELLKAKELAVQQQARMVRETQNTKPCKRHWAKELRCDKCRRHFKAKNAVFYHCCHCKSDGTRENYDQCTNCGSRCKDSGHGVMKLVHL